MAPLDRQRIEVLLHHWQHHNEEHADSFDKYARQLREQGWEKIAAYLEEASQLSRQTGELLRRALADLS
ncbi:MAG: hypothetical protein JRJ12_03875 [Deltaproteobacteria bacterium]|nr:hypothetical protein [Deltaproteobacteria bacterium]MBW2070194.1 hypothetical protein [Deltaproteobacteria bacterium]